MDVCAEVDLSSAALNDALRLNLGTLLGDICLCLSAFPLHLDLNADLVDQTDLETLLKSFVRHDVLLFVPHTLMVSSEGRREWYPLCLS